MRLLAHLSTAAALSLLTALCAAQSNTPSADLPAAERPLPDVTMLMHEVEQHQRQSESVRQNYLYHEDARREDDKGRQIEWQEYDVFWINGVQVHKLIRKDGHDLSEKDKKKEDERVDKEVAKAKERRRKADEKGVATDSHGHEEVTVSRFLTLGSFTNPRRVILDGRDTIAIDYTGDPRAKTRNRFEEVVRDLAGTLWIDEQDHAIVRMEGHFVDSYKIGGGLVMSIHKGTKFYVQQRKINSEVWLPSLVTGEGAARVLLFANFNGKVRVTDSDYRRFSTSATILPGVAAVQPEGSPAAGETPSASASETADSPR